MVKMFARKNSFQEKLKYHVTGLCKKNKIIMLQTFARTCYIHSGYGSTGNPARESLLV